VPEAGVVRAEDDEASRQFGRGVKRRRDVAAVHQSGVRYDGSDEPFLRFRFRILGETGRHLGGKALRNSLVKRAGDGWRARGHGRNVIAFMIAAGPLLAFIVEP
jgi:hypothetical protein